MRMQRGFTLIELMVVIVIIGILAALAIPKMMGVSTKAKVSEAPNVAAAWETLQSAYVQETGATGTLASIGVPGGAYPASTWWAYTQTTAAAVDPAIFQAQVNAGINMGTCIATSTLTSTFTVATDAAVHGPGAAGSAPCRIYIPNF